MFKSYILLLVSAFIVMAENVRVMPHIYTFLGNNHNIHRAGLLVKSDNLFKDTTVNTYNLEEDSTNCWFNNTPVEYSVNNEESAYVKNLFKKLGSIQFLQEDFYVIYPTTKKKEEKILPWNKIRKKSSGDVNKDIEDYKPIADNIVSSNLSMLKNKIEFDSYRIEYIKLTDDFLSEDIDTVTVTYRRIFSKGIIRKNLSYVEITLDTDGNLCYYKIKWPEFKKIKLDKIKEKTITSNEALEEAKLSSSSLTEIKKDNEKHYATSIEIQGASLSWLLITGDILTPCFTFLTNVDYDNGHNIKKYIDIPIIKYYYPE